MLPIDVTAFWPLSRPLLHQILEDRCSDRFVCERIWERLGYDVSEAGWRAGAQTSPDWAEAFPQAPEVIAQRLDLQLNEKSHVSFTPMANGWKITVWRLHCRTPRSEEVLPWTAHGFRRCRFQGKGFADA